MRTDLWNILEPVHVDPARKSWKDVLRNLVFHANLQGLAWPSVATIRAETGYKSDKAITAALAGLRECGIIATIPGAAAKGGRGKTTKWCINNLSNNVHKLTSGEGERKRDTLQKGEPTSIDADTPKRDTPQKGEPTSKRVNLLPEKGEVTSARIYKGNKKEVSKSVSKRRKSENPEVTSPFVDNSPEAGRNASAEGSPAPHGPGPKQIAPSARKEARREPRQRIVQVRCPEIKPDYVAMCAKLGWKPNDPRQTPPEDAELARRSIVACAYREGLSPEQAKEFLRYNAVRRWNAIDQANCVKDLVKKFLDKWKENDIEAYWAEARRRREAAERKGRP